MPNNAREVVEAAVLTSSMWWLWWFIHYIDQVRKWQRFNFWLAVVNVVISAWIGWLIQPLIPDIIQWNMRYSITSASWFLSYPILTILEKRWLDIIIKKINK